MQRLEVLGWWFSPFAPSTLPLPQALVGAWEPRQRELVLPIDGGVQVESFVSGHQLQWTPSGLVYHPR